MKMKKLIILVILAMLSAVVPLTAQSSSDSVGLGISAGIILPSGDTANISSTDWKTAINWGFYVNIPLIYTFHITPMAELYKFGNKNATDIALGFKFIIPAWVLDLYVGFVPGLTTAGEITAPHVGGVAGCAFNLFSNLDLFIEAKYKVMFNLEEDTNLTVLHANAGILYHF